MQSQSSFPFSQNNFNIPSSQSCITKSKLMIIGILLPLATTHRVWGKLFAFWVVGIGRRANLFIYLSFRVFLYIFHISIWSNKTSSHYCLEKVNKKCFCFVFFLYMKFGLDYNCIVFCGLFRPICSSGRGKSDALYINLISTKSNCHLCTMTDFWIFLGNCWGSDCRLFSL